MRLEEKTSIEDVGRSNAEPSIRLLQKSLGQTTRSRFVLPPPQLQVLQSGTAGFARCPWPTDIAGFSPRFPNPRPLRDGRSPRHDTAGFREPPEMPPIAKPPTVTQEPQADKVLGQMSTHHLSLCVSMYIHTYVYVYVCVYIHIYVCICVKIYTCISVRVCMYA